MDEQFPRPLRRFLDEHLTPSEEIQIVDQIYGHCLRNRQVLWTGMARGKAQSWADTHHMQTLTTSMGPLMDPNDARCPQQTKTDNAWSKYVHGASAIFAWYISKGDLVTVLTHPPPELFHPSGKTSYQVIEEPILKGMLGNSAVGRIELVHPSVPNATVRQYQFWPKNESYRWKPASCSNIPHLKWRKVKLSGPPRGFEVDCRLPGPSKASARRVEEPHVAENRPQREAPLTEREKHQLNCLEGELSKARNELQQQQSEARKKLLDRQSKEEKSMQKTHQQQLSAVSRKKKKATRREELRRTCDDELRHLRDEHRRVKVDLRRSHDKALKKLKNTQEEKIGALKKKQKKERQAVKLKVEQNAKLDQEKTEAKLKEEQDKKQAQEKRGVRVTAKREAKLKAIRGVKLKEKENAMMRLERERTLNSGIGGREAADLVRDLFFSLLLVGFKYVVDSLIYLTQSPSSCYETAV